MATTLYLIRHGATEGSEERRYKGSIDVPLSVQGMKEIGRTALFMADMLEGVSLSAIYASPLSRARKSAEIIGEAFALMPTTVDAFRERHFGIWEGKTFTEINQYHPEAFAAWAVNPLQYSPVGGESTLAVRDRLMPALSEILSCHRDEHVALVAHGGVNRIILCDVMGIPLQNIFRIAQDTAALNIITFYEHYPIVKLLNG